MRFSHVLGPGNGPATARVLFVGEAPGRLGAGRTGIPFVGDESGRRFDALLALAGLSRDDVFITNALLCNPVDGEGRNRRPGVGDIERCLPFLRGQIDAVEPAVVVALGGVALDALRRIEIHEALLARDCGRAIGWYERSLVPLYHPGRRALVHRPETLQQDDWRRLGLLLANA
jgi:DNA polymerase